MAGSFSVSVKQVPSAQLVQAAASLHVDPAKIMRDYYAIRQTTDNVRLVVGDMANNIVGTAVVLPELAGWAGLPADMPLNGGLAGSLVCRRRLIESDVTGGALIKTAHDILKQTCEACGMPARLDPAERFTGYFTHVQITPQDVTLTAIGDVLAWVNGRQIAGAEKQVDTEKALLVKEVWGAYTAKDAAGVREAIGSFVRRARLDSPTATALREQIARLSLASGRQAVYRAVDSVITPWHIRNLQNKPANSHPWAYGAIDGTKTPAAFIQVIILPTAKLHTLVVATDGSAALRPGAGVRAIDDLQPVNSEYSEQTIVAVRRTGN